MKIFKEDKWSAWWDSLPENTRIYLESQPIWYDRDVAKFVSIALVVGFIVGFFTGYR
jgi:hypothetical protein